MKSVIPLKRKRNELDIPNKAIRSMIKQGSIPHIRLQNSKEIRIKKSWLDNVLKDYPTEKEYKEAKENIRFDADANRVQPKITDLEVNNSEVTEDMAKKKTESTNTEIITNKPKVKEFIPNPNKRNKKSQVKENKGEILEDKAWMIMIKTW
jgi:hypothetical protein